MRKLFIYMNFDTLVAVSGCSIYLNTLERTLIFKSMTTTVSLLLF